MLAPFFRGYLLGSFNYGLLSSDMRTPVGQLSRGQLTKLAILQVILRPLDLLILDELTNHLDIRARENIEQALADYLGAILYATHDQVLADKLGGEEIKLGG